MCMFCFAAVASGSSLCLVLHRCIASPVSSTSRQLVDNTCVQVFVCTCYRGSRALSGDVLVKNNAGSDCNVLF